MYKQSQRRVKYYLVATAILCSLKFFGVFPHSWAWCFSPVTIPVALYYSCKSIVWSIQFFAWSLAQAAKILKPKEDKS